MTAVSESAYAREPRLDEIIELAREWARPYADAPVHGEEGWHPLDCPQQPEGLCFECANEALALGVLALIDEAPSAAG